MPNRILKESINSSETILALSPLAERFFYRLMVACDDHGRFDARPALIKGRVFPLDERVGAADVAEWLSELQSVGLVRLYEAAGKLHLEFATWHQHQNVRAKSSKFPDPERVCGKLTADQIIRWRPESNAGDGSRLIASAIKCDQVPADAPVSRYSDLGSRIPPCPPSKPEPVQLSTAEATTVADAPVAGVGQDSSSLAEHPKAKRPRKAPDPAKPRPGKRFPRPSVTEAQSAYDRLKAVHVETHGPWRGDPPPSPKLFHRIRDALELWTVDELEESIRGNATGFRRGRSAQTLLADDAIADGIARSRNAAPDGQRSPVANEPPPRPVTPLPELPVADEATQAAAREAFAKLKRQKVQPSSSDPEERRRLLREQSAALMEAANG